MPLLIGTTMICLAALWLMVLLIGGRNPRPPWWANDWMLGDVQVPALMMLAIIGISFMNRFMGGHAPGAAKYPGRFVCTWPTTWAMTWPGSGRYVAPSGK